MATTTANGALTHASSDDALVDLFYGMCRSSKEAVWNGLPLVEAAWKANPLDALRIIFHARDCRGGKGDRAPFLAAISWVLRNDPSWFDANFKHIPEYGRWKDIVELLTSSPETQRRKMAAFVAEQLRIDKAAMDEGGPVSLCAKWFPREGKQWDIGGVRMMVATYLLNDGRYLKDSVSVVNRRLRKEFVSPLSEHIKLVETLMCAGRWTDIDFSKLPSCAHNRYMNALKAHDGERYTAWLVDVVAKRVGVKVNAGQLYPYQLVTQYFYGSEKDDTVEVQWDALVEKQRLKNGGGGVVVVADVSASMNGRPMYNSIALGRLFSQLIDGPFRDKVITFSEQPTFVNLSQCKSLFEAVTTLRRAPWGSNTNFQAVFDLILNLLAADVPAPKKVLVLSDMQFDQAAGGEGFTNHEIVKARFEEAGKTMPGIVFWNLNGEYKNIPVKHDTPGVVLLSGFSPSLINLVLSDCVTPQQAMRMAIDDPRYERIVAP